MDTEEYNQPDLVPANDDPLQEPLETTKPFYKSNYLFIGLGVLLLCCIGLFATGIVNINAQTDFYAGSYSIDKVLVTDELDTGEKPANWQSKTNFTPTSKITVAVQTTGANGIIGMRWYHEDTFLFEFFERTIDNYITTFLEGQFRQPLPSGNYHVDIYLGRTSSPVKTVYFIVNEMTLDIVPPQPTPPGHEDIENSMRLEIPFAFDEVWLINGKEWAINEVKIVFLDDAELLAIIVETDLDPAAFSEEELKVQTKPIATYAVENGYLDEARQIQINEQTYDFYDTLYVTLINPQNPGNGYRVPFKLDELQ